MTLITGTITDLAGAPDSTAWEFYTPLRESDNGVSVITTQRVRRNPVAGALSVTLDPGFAVVSYKGLVYNVTVPASGPVDIYDLLAAAVAFPPGTSAQDVAAAVNAYMATSSAVFWESLGPVPLANLQLHTATAKTPPVDADEIPLLDSAASFGVKKVTWANVKAAIKAYYDSVTSTLTNKSISGSSNTLTNISADSLIDGTTNKAFLATERTKLTGIATAATANATDAQLRDRTTHTGTQTSSTIADFTEAAQDAVAALLAGTSGVSLSYDDAANTLTITGPGSSSALAEDIRDAIGIALLGSGLISVAVNDGADTITISTTATANDTDANLKARANHTGSQTASTISDFSTAADARVAALAVVKSLVDAKGDLFVGTADNTVGRQAVGANRSYLKASSSQTAGVRWAADRVFNITDPEYGAIGDGDSAKATANTAAVQNAINDAFAAGGGIVFVPASTGAYCFNGVVIPTTGYVFLVGDGPGLSVGTGAVTGSVLRNVHATNPSVKAWSSVPDDGSTNRFWGIRNIGFDASAIRTGQAALDLNWAVRWDVDNIRVSYMDIGVKCRLSWGGSFRNLAIDNCTTGQSVVADVNGTSCPVVWDNLTVYNCTTGILSTNGLSGSSFFGGTIGNCVTGVNLVGTVNIGISFFGMFFENNSGDDIVLGISGTSGPTSVLFSNSVFQPHVGKTRSVLFGHGTEVTFDTCAWKAPFDAGTVTNGIVMQGGAGVLTLVNPRFENTTNVVTRGGIVHPVPPGTGLFTVYGYGAAAGTVSRIGNGVSNVPQVATPASSATPAINVDTCDLASITALATNVTSMSSGLTGTPYNGQQLRIRFTDNGTPRTIAWGASFSGPLPTTTVASTPLNVTVIYDSVLAQWVYGGAAGTGGLAAANNLADVASASTSRTNLGLAIGTDVQAWDADLDAWASKTAASTATASTVAQRDANANLLADAFIPSSTSTATAAGTTVLTTDSTEIQFFTGATTQTVTLPTTGVVAGHRFTVVNQSTGTVTVQSSGANTVFAIPSAVSTIFVANTTTPTTAAHWTFYVQQTSYASSLAAVSTIAARNAQANLLADVFITTLASVVTSAGTTTLTVDSAGLVVYTGSTTHTVTLPTTSVTAGHVYEFINTSSGAITINSSGGNLVKTLAANATTRVTALVATPTTAAHWFAS